MRGRRADRDDLESRTGKSVETAIETLDQFYLAEDYHQKYELRSTPVVADELEDTYGDAFVDSTVAARLNGFVAGHGEDDEREALFADWIFHRLRFRRSAADSDAVPAVHSRHEARSPMLATGLGRPRSQRIRPRL